MRSEDKRMVGALTGKEKKKYESIGAIPDRHDGPLPSPAVIPVISDFTITEEYKASI